MQWNFKFVEIPQKRENFLEILGKLSLKFEQFSSKIVSKLWLNFWENFRKNFLKFQENFREWMLQKFFKFYIILNEIYGKFEIYFE